MLPLDFVVLLWRGAQSMSILCDLGEVEDTGPNRLGGVQRRGAGMQNILVSRKEGLVEAEVDGEIVALHVDNGTCYGFNGTASAVWRMLDRPRRLDEICEGLVGEYEVEPDQCERE